MKGTNSIRPVNGIPYCKDCGKIFKDKISLANKHAVVGYAVDCRCEDKCKDKKG